MQSPRLFCRKAGARITSELLTATLPGKIGARKITFYRFTSLRAPLFQESPYCRYTPPTSHPLTLRRNGTIRDNSISCKFRSYDVYMGYICLISIFLHEILIMVDIYSDEN